jgi:hypothetical protein
MTSGLFDSDVKEAYRAVVACIEAFGVLTDVGHDLSLEWNESGYQIQKPSAALADRYGCALGRARRAVEKAAVAVAVVRDQAVGLWDKPVRVAEICAPTYLEAVQIYLDERAKALPEARSIRLEVEKERVAVFSPNLTRMGEENPFEGPWLCAQLRIEEVRLLAERSGAFSRVLLKLKGKSRDLMAFLIERRGRTVTLQELWMDFWREKGEYENHANRARQAIWKLRQDLDDEGFGPLAEKIVNVREEGYRLD